MRHARLAAHARNVIMISSSIGNEWALWGVPVLVTGHGWWDYAPGFHDQAKTWEEVTRIPKVDQAARNKGIRWWLKYHVYPDQYTERIEQLWDEFRPVWKIGHVSNGSELHKAAAKARERPKIWFAV